MGEVDILIIGAGVIGLAVAREVSAKNKYTVLLERNEFFGQETSSRNSEVIHGGMYYPEGTLKASLCVEGRHLLYDICRNNNIPCRRIGKLIVATESQEVSFLERLLIQGEKNGVEGLKIIGRQELMELEPDINGIAALYSPETGIINTHRLMQFFLDGAKSNGAVIGFQMEVIGIEKLPAGYKVMVKNGCDVTILKTRIVINCAGLDSDTVAATAGMDIAALKYRLHYCKGQYFRVGGEKKGSISHLIYPVPKPASGGLGIHATLDLAGGLRLGPDDKYLPDRNKDYSVEEFRKHDFYVSAKKFMPFLDEDQLSADTSGIRPKLQGQGEIFRDFIIQEESGNGFPGFINLIGIESPGLTASVAIAKFVNELVEK